RDEHRHAGHAAVDEPARDQEALDAHGRREDAGRDEGGVDRLAAQARSQCRKCLRPVNTIARPCSSAAAITSESFSDPPGCTTAVAPAAAIASRPSRNGMKASDAATDPFRTSAPRDAAFMRATFAASTRLI